MIISLVDNISDRIHSNKCTNCESSLDYMKVEDNQLIFKCLICNKENNKDFNKELIKDFQTHISFAMESLINLFFLLKKGIYLHEYMNS